MAKEPVNEPPAGQPYFEGKIVPGMIFRRTTISGVKQNWTVTEVEALKVRAERDSDNQLHTFETEDFRIGAELTGVNPTPISSDVVDGTIGNLHLIGAMAPDRSAFTVNLNGSAGLAPDRKHNHYFKDVRHLDTVDVYRVLKLFNVTDPCLQHAIKKLLVAGGRGGGKDITKDIKEAIDSLSRWQELQNEDIYVRTTL